MQTFYSISADFFFYVHSALILWVVLGLLLTLIGGPLKWRWVRNPWFRWTHLAIILVVIWESWADIECPLTTWENWCRAEAGLDTNKPEGFIATWLANLLYFDCDDVYFDYAYTGFGLLVILSFVLFPPRRFGKPKTEAAAIAEPATE